MFGKFFASTFTGSMIGCGADVFAIWGYVIANTGPDSMVEINPKMIAMQVGMTEQEVITAIEFLCEADPNSRSSVEDGSRLVRHGPFLYEVVNHAHYRGIRDNNERREANRLSQQKSRSKAMSSSLSSGHPRCQHNEEEKEDKEEKEEEKENAMVFDDEFALFKSCYPKRIGNQPWEKAKKAINARLKNGSSWGEIIEGAKRYAVFCAATDKLGTEYVLQAVTFCGPEKHFTAAWDIPATKAKRKQDKSVGAGVAWLGEQNAEQ